MKKKLLLAMSVFGLAVASAKSYSITLFQPAVLGMTELTAGRYKVDVEDQKATVHGGKITCEAPVKVESSDRAFGTTTVRFANVNGKMHIQEILVGGSKTKLVFAE